MKICYMNIGPETHYFLFTQLRHLNLEKTLTLSQTVKIHRRVTLTPGCADITLENFELSWSPLWPRGNIVTSHVAGPGSITGRVIFLVEVFPEFFLNCKRNVRKLGHIRTRVSYGHHIIQTIFIYMRTATVSDLRCSTWLSLNNQQQQQSNCPAVLHNSVMKTDILHWGCIHNGFFQMAPHRRVKWI